MKLKALIREMNGRQENSRFRSSLLAAKRDARRREDWCVVEVEVPIRGRRVKFFEALPPGWPLLDVAKRVSCPKNDVVIVAQYVFGQWWKPGI